VSVLGLALGAVALLAGALLGWTLVTLRRERDQLARREADAMRMAELDDLTGLGNYRMFMRQLTAEVARSRRYEDPFSLVLLDLDGFKGINDELGHLAGDDALRLVAIALREALREEDVCCRQGGDEFAVIAPETDLVEARELAGRLRERLATLAAGEFRIGASIGIACYPDDGETLEALLRVADDRLRLAKGGLVPRRPRRGAVADPG
jgi:diguanylate cyclase (GGDEF)-like protein